MSLIANPKGCFFGSEQSAPLVWRETLSSRLFAPIAGNCDRASHADMHLAHGGEVLRDTFSLTVDALSALRTST